MRRVPYELLIAGAAALGACTNFDNLAAQYCSKSTNPYCHPVVSVSISGVGMVVAQVDGGQASCGSPSCGLSFLAGTSVTLLAVPDGGNFLYTWGQDCADAGQGSCALSMTGPHSVSVAFGRYNYAFVTSGAHLAGGLGGLAGADSICQNAAKSGGHSGTYVALLGLSDGGGGYARLKKVPGWVRPDGQPIAASVTQLENTTQGITSTTSNTLWYPPMLDERGAVRTSSVLTGLYAAAFDAGTCEDWTSTDAGWTTRGSSPCGSQCLVALATLQDCKSSASLYCFETDQAFKVPAPPPIPGTGKLAFLSHRIHLDGGGYTQLVGECQAEADLHPFPGTFLPLVSTSSMAASSNFLDSGTAGWYRVDGVQLSMTAAGMLQPSPAMLASLSKRPDGTVDDALAWSGSADPNQAGTAATTCQDFTVPLKDGGLVVGISAMANFQMYDGTAVVPDCSASNAVYCLQQ